MLLILCIQSEPKNTKQKDLGFGNCFDNGINDKHKLHFFEVISNSCSSLSGKIKTFTEHVKTYCLKFGYFSK